MVGSGRNVRHDVRHNVISRAQAARADLTLNGLLRDGVEGAGLKAEADLIVAQQLVILLAKGVFRLRQYLDEILLAEAVQ